MEAIVGFRELEQIIAEKTGKQLSFKYVDERTVNVTYGKKIVFKPLSLNLRIEAIKENKVEISYEAGTFQEAVIASALRAVHATSYGDIFVIKGNQNVLLLLSNVPQLAKALEICEPESLTFSETQLTLRLRVK